MTKKNLWMELALVLATGCSVESGSGEGELGEDSEGFEPRVFPGPEPEPDPSQPSDSELSASVMGQACPSYRKAVKLVDDTCTHVAGFVGKKMFGNAATAPFDRYCVYEHPGKPSAAALLTFDTSPLFVEVATECMAVRTQSDDLLEATYPALRDLSIDRFGGVDGTDINLAGTAAGRQKVTVAVVDTTPLADPANPRSAHGIIVADLITDLAAGCATASPVCKVVVANVLGMPRWGLRQNEVDTTRGGFAAFPSEAAQGLYTAIKTWEDGSAPRPRLVINLSLGWPHPFGGWDMVKNPLDVGDMTLNDAPPGVDAFYLAVQRASCRGALIVAAAGNAKDDCGVGPLLPARWERLPAPTTAECLHAGVPLAAIVSSPPGTYQPLLHSIGGVDADDEPIAASREYGRPRLAALAESVVGTHEDYPPMTGTSLSAAALSGLAAMVWSYNPNLTAHEIMDLAWSSGVSVGEESDYGLDGTTSPIKRVRVCDALAAACAQTGACPASFALTCGSTPGLTEALADAIADVEPAASFDITVEELGQCDAYCSEETQNWFADGADDTCPELEGPSATDDLTSPQPDNAGCLGCTWVTSNTNMTTQNTVILAGLTRGFQGRNVTKAVVELTLVGQTLPDEYSLGDIDLVYGPARSFTIVNGPTAEITKGTVTLTFDGPLPNETKDELVKGVAQ